MQLESFTKKQLIQMIKEQQKSNETERRFYLKRIKELEEKIRELKK